MEFIKVGKNWLIKASNGRLISDEEKRKLEKQELVIEDKHCKECEIKPIKKKKSATSKKEIANDIIQETDSTI